MRVTVSWSPYTAIMRVADKFTCRWAVKGVISGGLCKKVGILILVTWAQCIATCPESSACSVNVITLGNTARGHQFTKTQSHWYSDSHYKPETVVRPSQVYNGDSYTPKTASFQWIKALTVHDSSPCLTHICKTTAHRVWTVWQSAMRANSH